MRNNIKRTVSIILLCALLAQLLPASVFAKEPAVLPENSSEPDMTEDILADDRSDTYAEALRNEAVLFEEKSLREEAVKHFRMEDGSYAAVAYGVPVHYEDAQGNWKDYDNTLKPVKSEDTVSGYRIKNGESTRLFAADGTAEQLVLLQKKDYSFAMTPICEAVKEEPEPEPELPEAMEEEQPESEPACEKPVKILTESAPSDEKITDPFLEKVQPAKLYSALEYEGLYPDAVLRYENYANTTKESIVIAERQESYIYSFRLELTNLKPCMREDGGIDLQSEDGTAVYTMPAPNLFDAAGAVSYDAAYRLEEEGGNSVLTVTAEPAWINSEERVFPVTLDPTVTETCLSDANISATFVSSGFPNGTSGSETGLYVGNSGNNNAQTRTYVHINDLVSLPTGCEVCYAEFELYHYAMYGSSLDIDLHRLTSVNGLNGFSVTSDWQTWANGLTWNSAANTTGCSDIIADRATAKTSTQGSYLSWDISTLAFDWYTDRAENLGFLLKAKTESEACRATFYGPKKTSNRPRFTIVYRNTAGIEPQYTYQTVNIGRAGISYISDYSMQNTLVVPIVSSGSEVNAFELSLVYNSVYDQNYFTANAEGLHTKDFSTMVIGAGWKLSAQQTVVSQSVGGTTYLIYNDDDGTEHYFLYCSDGYYHDEDGLGLKISGSASAYTMSNDYGDKKKFTYGYLSEETDAYGNAIYYAYNGNAYSAGSSNWKPTSNGTNRLTSVWRKNTGESQAEQLVLIGYNGNYVNTIISECDYSDEDSKASHRIALGRAYSGTEYRLTSITYPDGAAAQYTYFTSNSYEYERYRLNTAYDSESLYGIEYSYSYTRDVRNICEYTMAGTTVEYGTKMHGYKRAHSQAVYRYYGKDQMADKTDAGEPVAGASGDDILTYKVLDTSGRTVGSYSADNTEQHILGVGAASYVKNEGTSKKNNRITADASAGQQGINLLQNSSAENGTSGWSGAAVSGTYAYIGAKAFYVTNNVLYQTVSLESNREYTFSAYVRKSASGSIKLAFYRSSTAIAESKPVNYATIGTNHDWMRISVTLPADCPGGSYQVRVVPSGSCTAYVDCLQLEEEDAASSYNILENSSFQQTTTLPTSANFGWYRTANVSVGSNASTSNSNNDETGNTRFGNQFSLITGGGNARVSQSVALNLPLTSTFLLSGWGWGQALPRSVAEKENDTDPYYGIILRLYFSDGTNEASYFPFDAYYGGWQYVQGIVVPKKTGNVTITSATVAAAFDNNINTAHFDNFSLRMEPVQTYRYDENGNPVAATSSAGGSESAAYSGVDLTQYTAANGNKINYTYNSAHDVKTAKISNSLTNTYTYNNSGSVTQSKLTAAAETQYLQSSATVTADQNHTASSTDVNNNTTHYSYDSYSEQLVSVTDPRGQTTQNEYEVTNNRLLQTYLDGIASIHYIYGNNDNDTGRLTQLDRKTFRDNTVQHQYYNFDYNIWGQRTTFKVGSQTLLTNEYADINRTPTGSGGGNLTKTTYGNGQFVEYTYDKFDRLIRKAYNTGRYVEYFYNAEGALSKIAYGNGTNAKGSYEFEYDSLGRLIRSAEYDGSGALVQRTEHNYDAYNRLSSQKWVLGSDSYSESYSYSDGEDGDGSLTQMTTGTNNTLNYTYDSLKRLQSVKAKTGSTTLLTTAYAYRTVNGNQTSAQVEYRNVRLGDSSDILEGKKYTYDTNGNITLISQSTGNFYPLVSYEYDSQNQLTKETHYDGTGTGSLHITNTYVYTYDTAGNIQSEVKRIKRNGRILSTSTKSYTYGNSTWRDKLTAINGNTITYDNSGNPTVYHNGATELDMVWSNGRQLSYVGCYEERWQTSYSYDADGIRTQKNDDGTLHKYITQNGKVVRETIGSGSTAKILDFIYDESGRPFALIYDDGVSAPKTYYYILNLQGDVVKLVDDDSEVQAVYSYDAWGNKLDVTDDDGNPITSQTHIAHVNPLRYRGYYYDTETGFYYLQSRYYDPVTHRFINADSYASTDYTDAIACNMFAYCGNNPVICIDAEGNRPFVNTMMTDSGTGNAKRFSAVVLYYDTGNDFTEQATTQFAFASEYYSVKYIGISNAEELILAWGTWSSTTDVYMYFHGGNERLYFQGESVTAEELTGANITKSIYLFACNGDEIAKKLASNNNCKVVACAVGVSYDYIDGMAYPHAGTRLNNILFGPKWEWYITYPSGNKSQMIGNSICYIE